MRGYGQLEDFTGSAGLSLSYTDSSTLLLSKEPAPEGAAKKKPRYAAERHLGSKKGRQYTGDESK